jgi:UDP-galactopyranose mutase
MNSICETFDLLVFSQTRWDHSLPRAQHVLGRYASYRRVYYFEEPVIGVTDLCRIHLKETQEGVMVVVPYLPAGLKEAEIQSSLRELVDELIYEEEINNMTILYTSPSALAISRHLEPAAVIYDCEEIEHNPSAHLGSELLEKADLVFTTNKFLTAAGDKVHTLPQSVDAEVCWDESFKKMASLELSIPRRKYIHPFLHQIRPITVTMTGAY